MPLKLRDIELNQKTLLVYCSWTVGSIIVPSGEFDRGKITAVDRQHGRRQRRATSSLTTADVMRQYTVLCYQI